MKADSPIRRRSGLSVSWQVAVYRLRSWLRPVLAWGVIIVLGALALYQTERGLRRPSALPAVLAVVTEIDGVAVAPVHLDLGEIWEAKQHAHELPIENRTRQPVTITQFATSCGCISVVPDSLTLAPSETRRVTVNVDTGHRGAVDMGKPIRDFASRVTPLVESPGGGRRQPAASTHQNQLSEWTLKGKVRSRVTFDLAELSFGSQRLRGDTRVPRKTIATVHVPFRSVPRESSR